MIVARAVILKDVFTVLFFLVEVNFHFCDRRSHESRDALAVLSTRP